MGEHGEAKSGANHDRDQASFAKQFKHSASRVMILRELADYKSLTYRVRERL